VYITKNQVGPTISLHLSRLGRKTRSGGPFAENGQEGLQDETNFGKGREKTGKKSGDQTSAKTSGEWCAVGTDGFSFKAKFAGENNPKNKRSPDPGERKKHRAGMKCRRGKKRKLPFLRGGASTSTIALLEVPLWRRR